MPLHEINLQIEKYFNPNSFNGGDIKMEKLCLYFLLLIFAFNYSNGQISEANPTLQSGMQQLLQNVYMDLLTGRDGIQQRHHFNLSFVIPDLQNISKECPRDAFFAGMNPDHMKAVSDVKKILLGSGNSGLEILRIASQLRDRDEIHPKVWYYALSSAAYDHPELQGIYKPGPEEIMADVFIPPPILKQVWRNMTQNQNESTSTRGTRQRQQQTCVILDDRVGVRNGIENRLWYFREDISVNAHHWFYQEAYRLDTSPREDRRGELFYYIHHEMLARYNAERFANGLQRTKPITLSHGAILEEGYVSNLEDTNSGQRYSDRPNSSVINDIGQFISVNELQLVNNRFLRGIRNKFLRRANGTRAALDARDGIDIFSDALQAHSLFSVNPEFYGLANRGGLHNNGHQLIAYLHDTNLSKRSPPGVMNEEATAMRDIAFYRWHTNVDNLFDTYLRTLPPYQTCGGELPLNWNGVRIRSLQVLSDRFRDQGFLQTFWNFRRLRLNRGLDLFRRNNGAELDICSKHLDHEPFNYRFTIQRQRFVNTPRATVRIFMAPRFRENGQRFTMEEQRRFFFALDIFIVNLRIGNNVILRRSTDSTLTVPYTNALPELIPENRTADFRPYCGCGWPHHLLLPKGTPQGMTYDLFIMVTNGDEDFVQNMHPGQVPGCRSAPLFCGIPNQKYPDARPMGYPFDRLPYISTITIPVAGDATQRTNPTLDHFISGISNMATRQVVIRHRESS